MSDNQNAGGGAVTLPVLEIAKAAYLVIFENALSVGRLMLPLLIVSSLRGIVDGPISGWPTVIVWVVALFCAHVMFLTAVFRLSNGEDPASIKMIRWSRKETVFAGYCLLLALVGILAAVSIYVLMSMLRGPLVEVASTWVVGLLLVLFVARTSLTFAAVALGESCDLTESWDRTRGYTLLLVLIYLLTAVPFLVFSGSAVRLTLGFGDLMQIGFLSPFLGIIAETVMEALSAAVGAAVALQIYRKLPGRWVPND